MGLQLEENEQKALHCATKTQTRKRMIESHKTIPEHTFSGSLQQMTKLRKEPQEARRLEALAARAL